MTLKMAPKQCLKTTQFILLDEDSVDENKGERDDEEDVGEVEDKLGHMVLCAVPLHIPVSDSDLESLNFEKERESAEIVLKCHTFKY